MQDFDIQDDLQVSEESYPEQQRGFVPPLPGNYEVQVPTDQWGLAKRQDGELVLYRNREGNPTYPVIEVKQVEINQPFEYSRKVGVFQKFSSVPFAREEGKMASQVADMLRGFDASATASNTGEVLSQLTNTLKSGGSSMRVRVDYQAYDKVFADSQIAAAGGKQAISDKEKYAIYNKATIKGYRKIQQSNIRNGKGNLPLWKWQGPSGEIVEAKPQIVAFFPSNEEVELGPDKKALES